jgi:hypothetical protein
MECNNQKHNKFGLREVVVKKAALALRITIYLGVHMSEITDFIPPQPPIAGAGVPIPYSAAVPTAPSPDPTQPAFPDPTAGTRTGQPPQPQFAQVDPRVAAAQADQQHHSAIGRVAHAIMGNTVSFEPQPDGTVKKTLTPTKPGDLFRGLLLSGVLGASTQAHGFGEGFAKGISGAAERGIQNQDKMRAETIQNEQLKRQKQQLDMNQQKAADVHSCCDKESLS